MECDLFTTFVKQLMSNWFSPSSPRSLWSPFWSIATVFLNRIIHGSNFTNEKKSNQIQIKNKLNMIYFLILNQNLGSHRGWVHFHAGLRRRGEWNCTRASPSKQKREKWEIRHYASHFTSFGVVTTNGWYRIRKREFSQRLMRGSLFGTESLRDGNGYFRRGAGKNMRKGVCRREKAVLIDYGF